MKDEFTDHQRLNVMLTVAAGRAGKLTGIDTAQCTRTWHMYHTPCFFTVSNNLDEAKRECELMQESTDEIILDCMKVKVIQCKGIFIHPHKKELSDLLEGELTAK
jgi:hypothetical protein